MNLKYSIAFFVCIILILFSCSKNEENNNAEKFTIRTGVNVSHWLSQNINRGETRKNYITEADFDSIKSAGFDHIRLPVDEVQLWDSAGNKEAEAFKILHNAIDWAVKRKLRVIVDLHIIRAHFFNSETNIMWTDPAERKKVVLMWKELSDELKNYPDNILAYEILSEAGAETPEEWNELLNNVIKNLRIKEPNRKIIIGSIIWQKPQNVPLLKLPENDKNIIISFHCFSPSALTLYSAPWTPFSEYRGKVNYPGWTVDTLEYNNLSSKAVKAMREYANGYYNKEKLAELMMPAIRYAKEKNLPLYCGEYGVYPKIDEKIMFRWYKDICSVFNEHNIAYSHWCYKGDFPVINQDGSINRKLTGILTSK